MSYTFQGMTLTDQNLAPLHNWVDTGWLPAGFLQTVMANDLIGAVERADAENIHKIPAYIAWLYNQAPSDCWGSAKKIRAWHDKKLAELREQEKSDA
jgi:hypothetical protein